MPACGALRFLRTSRTCNPPSALALDPKPKARRYAPSRHGRPLTLGAMRKTHLEAVGPVSGGRFFRAGQVVDKTARNRRSLTDEGR